MPHHLAGVAVLSVLSTSAAIAHGPEIPPQYRGLWCDLGNDKYQRCRKADTESYLDVGRKEISGLGEEVPACGVDKLVEIKNGWRIVLVCPPANEIREVEFRLEAPSSAWLSTTSRKRAVAAGRAVLPPAASAQGRRTSRRCSNLRSRETSAATTRRGLAPVLHWQ
jgi:hypothetical protein